MDLASVIIGVAIGLVAYLIAASFLCFVLGVLAGDYGSAPIPETERAGGLSQGPPAREGEREGAVVIDELAKAGNGALFHTSGASR